MSAEHRIAGYITMIHDGKQPGQWVLKRQMGVTDLEISRSQKKTQRGKRRANSDKDADFV